MTVGMLAGLVIAVVGVALAASGTCWFGTAAKDDLADLLVGAFLVASGVVIYCEARRTRPGR